MNRNNQIILFTTFGLFFTEAIIHYNIGKNDTKTKEPVKIKLPPAKSLVKIAVVVAAFSLINQQLIKKLTQ